MFKMVDINASDINTTLSAVDKSPTLSGIVTALIVAFILFLIPKVRQITVILFKKAIHKFIKKEPFEVLNLRKHATVCANGHLIVLHDFQLKINDKNTTERFTRKFDVSDAAKDCKLPIFKNMLSTDIKDRFNKYGFWFRSSPENIFTEVKEDSHSNNNNKRKTFYFRFNKSALKNLNTNIIKLMYGYSIRFAHPLANGYYNPALDTNLEPTNKIESAFEVRYKMNILEYIFSFTSDVKIDEDNISVIYYKNGFDGGKEEKIIPTKKDDLYYNKWHFKIKNPKLNSVVKIITPVISEEL